MRPTASSHSRWVPDAPCTSGTWAIPLPRREGHPTRAYTAISTRSHQRVFSEHHRPVPRTAAARIPARLSSQLIQELPCHRRHYPQAMLRATLQLHLAIPSNPIQLQFHRRIMPWLETSSSVCALLSRRISADASLGARCWTRIHSSNFASFASWKLSRVCTASRFVRSSPMYIRYRQRPLRCACHQGYDNRISHEDCVRDTMKGSTLTRERGISHEDCVQLSCKPNTDSETGISHEDCAQQALRNTQRCQRTRGGHPVRLHVESRHLAFASVVSALGKITVAGPVEEMHTKLSPVHGDNTWGRFTSEDVPLPPSGSCVGSDAHHLKTSPEGNCNISKTVRHPVRRGRCGPYGLAWHRATGRREHLDWHRSLRNWEDYHCHTLRGNTRQHSSLSRHHRFECRVITRNHADTRADTSTKCWPHPRSGIPFTSFL